MSIDLDTTGGSVCPGPMTRTQLLNLRSSGSLDVNCAYIVTDYNHGTLGAATIRLEAVDATTLSTNVSVATSFDNVAWTGQYDIDLNLVTHLSDNLGNQVSGPSIVATFPWGVAAVSDNILLEPTTFTYTQGTFRNNMVKSGAVLVIDGAAGNAARNTFGEDSAITWRRGDMRENVIHSDAVVNVDTTGDFDNNVIGSLSRVDLTGSGNIDTCEMGQSSNLIVAAGAVSDTVLGTDCTLTTGGGSVYENTINNSSDVTLTTTSAFYHNEINGDSTLVIGGHNFYGMTVSKSSINTTGSGGAGMRYGSITDCTSFTAAQHVATLDCAYFKFANTSSAAITGAARSYLWYCTFENYGRILQSAGTQIDLNYVGVRDYGYVRTQAGRMYVSNTTVSHVAYIDHITTGTNRVDSVLLTSRARVQFLGTCNNNRVYYCEGSSGAIIEHRGTSTGCYFYYCEVTSSSSLYTNNSVNLRAYYSAVSGNSEISSQGGTNTHYIYYCVASGQGYIRLRDGLGRFYAIHASSQGLVTLTGGTANSHLCHSHFSAYYHLFLTGATLTTTRHSVSCAGRRSYTPAAPIANGTYTQNIA